LFSTGVRRLKPLNLKVANVVNREPKSGRVCFFVSRVLKSDVVTFRAREPELKSDKVSFTKLLTPRVAGLSFINRVLKCDVVVFRAGEPELKSDEISFTKLLTLRAVSLSFVS